MYTAKELLKRIEETKQERIEKQTKVIEDAVDRMYKERLSFLKISLPDNELEDEVQLKVNRLGFSIDRINDEEYRLDVRKKPKKLIVKPDNPESIFRIFMDGNVLTLEMKKYGYRYVRMSDGYTSILFEHTTLYGEYLLFYKDGFAQLISTDDGRVIVEAEEIWYVNEECAYARKKGENFIVHLPDGAIIKCNQEGEGSEHISYEEYPLIPMPSADKS